MRVVVTFVLCYLLGSIPTAYLLAKWIKGIDIRTVGSGNVGATNALRTIGPWAGVVVLVIDVLKGVMAVRILPVRLLGIVSPGLALACGGAAVVGHAFPCFLQFRGGKGVATTMGVLLGSTLLIAGVVVGVWLLVFLSFRYVSLASVVAAVAIPLSQLAWHRSLSEVMIGSVLALLILIRHSLNLQRLLSGVEHRAWSRKG